MINNLRTNHLTNPYGIKKDHVVFSFIASEGKIFDFNLLDDENNLLFKTKVELKDTIGFEINYSFIYGKKYYWFISNEKEKSNNASFLVADILDAHFISTKEAITHPQFTKDFSINEEIVEARLIITGLGLYQAFINECKVGNNYLTPGFNDYDSYLRYQEYDVTSLLKENNHISVILGDGWYKGRIGFDNHPGEVYGNKYLLAAKLIIRTKSGIKEIKTDETWIITNSIYNFSNIYDGENKDSTKEIISYGNCIQLDKTYNLEPQGGAFVTSKESLKPELIRTKNQNILDFKQNAVGFVRFKDKYPRGTKITFKYGEVLQNGEFYNENLRTAKQEFVYVCSNSNKIVEPYFTFYGFRYVLIEGLEEIDIDNFEAAVLTSELDKTIEITTNNKKINQLISNAYWGQKDNFIDIPMDCPQRDERLGWTADSQVFSKTASFNMFTYPFYQKYLNDLRMDQINYYHGNIPAYSPSLKGDASVGGAVWSDCATILPWNLYIAYGDKRVLQDNYELMKDYVDTLIKHDEETGNKHLVLDGFTFGDWLAQDGVTPQSLKGGTDDNYIQSIYYYVSVDIFCKVNHELGRLAEEEKYNSIREEIKLSILNEFFSTTGRLTIDTQTGYILSLYYDIYRNKDKVTEGLKKRLEKDLFKLKTGFTGTPLALLVLFDNGLSEEAYRILFNEKCPSWLYAINLGATTIWERWNSLLEDGTISGTSMNSLNHYAYGSVCEAIYTKIAGMNCVEPGFKKVLFKPILNYRINHIDMTYHSVIGKYHIDYQINLDNTIDLNIEIPHGGEGILHLPNIDKDELALSEGIYHYHYELNQDYIHPYSSDTRLIDLMLDTKAIEALKVSPIFLGIANDQELSINSLKMLSNLHFLPIMKQDVDKVDVELKKIIYKGDFNE